MPPPRLSLTSDGGLVLKYAQPSDGGWYRCVAGNAGGTDIAEAYLSVVSVGDTSMLAVMATGPNIPVATGW